MNGEIILIWEVNYNRNFKLSYNKNSHSLWGTDRFSMKYRILGASLVAQLLKNRPAMWETWVQSLGWEVLTTGNTATVMSLQSCPTLCDPIEIAAHQAPLSLGFSRQEYWSGSPFPSPMRESEKWKWSRSVVSNCSRPHGLQPTRLLCPWDFPSKNTGVGCHRLLRTTGDR